MKVVIYTKDNCNWCVKAKQLMNSLYLNYDEKVLDQDYTRDYLRRLVYGDEPASMTPPLTVPQIFVDGYRVGGYEDFVEWCDDHGVGNE